MHPNCIQTIISAWNCSSNSDQRYLRSHTYILPITMNIIITIIITIVSTAMMMNLFIPYRRNSIFLISREQLLLWKLRFSGLLLLYKNRFQWSLTYFSALILNVLWNRFCSTFINYCASQWTSFITAYRLQNNVLSEIYTLNFIKSFTIYSSKIVLLKYRWFFNSRTRF